MDFVYFRWRNINGVTGLLGGSILFIVICYTCMYILQLTQGKNSYNIPQSAGKNTILSCRLWARRKKKHKYSCPSNSDLIIIFSHLRAFLAIEVA